MASFHTSHVAGVVREAIKMDTPNMCAFLVYQFHLSSARCVYGMPTGVRFVDTDSGMATAGPGAPAVLGTTVFPILQIRNWLSISHLVERLAQDLNSRQVASTVRS